MQFRFLIGDIFLASLLRQSPSINCDSSEFFPYSMEGLVMVISFTNPAIQNAWGEANRTQLQKKKCTGKRIVYLAQRRRRLAGGAAVSWLHGRRLRGGANGCFPTVRRRSNIGSFLLFQLLEFPLSFTIPSFSTFGFPVAVS
ncbi:hypothetical protein D5086_013459 [Populus alba]|uniref:Uncharacterized protein n=1 Tax=Populus alba TaxID=43335 RepID=A0ACC4C6W5_POPAL